MRIRNGNGVALRGVLTPTRDRAVGSSPLTVRIYRTVLDAGRSMAAHEIYDRVKNIPGFHTDTELWAQRQDQSRKNGGTIATDLDVGLLRIRDRIRTMVNTGVLISDGHARTPSYSAGRPPKGFATIPPGPVDGQYGWYDIDVRGQRERLTDHLALVVLLENARTELAKAKMSRARELLTEAVRLLEKVSFQ